MNITDDYYFCPLSDDEPEYPWSIIPRSRWEKMMEFQKMLGFRGFRDLTGGEIFVMRPVKKQLEAFGEK